MKHVKLAAFLSFLLILSNVSPASAWCDICDWKNLFKTTPKSQKAEPLRIISDNGVSINLQNPHTRKIARCYNNNVSSAEDCARYFEQHGFVRFRDIPYKTANYDFLHVDTYPTRRWRDSELTSRW